MTDDEVGSLADELQLLAIAIGSQDQHSPDSVLGMIRQFVSGSSSSDGDAPDVQRIDLT